MGDGAITRLGPRYAAPLACYRSAEALGITEVSVIVRYELKIKESMGFMLDFIELFGI
jgi:hypothetical protein